MCGSGRRRIRRLRNRLGLTGKPTPKTYGILLASIRLWEIGRHTPPPAVRVYFKVMEAEPEVVAKAVGEVA